MTTLAVLSVAWVAIGFIFIALFRIPLLGIFIAPPAILALIGILAAPPASSPSEMSPRIFLHAIFGFAGYAAFFTASLGAGSFFLLDRELRRKHLGALFENLPPLKRATDIMRVGIKSGLYCLGTSVVTAAMFLSDPDVLRDPNIRGAAGLMAYGAVLFVIGKKRGWGRPETAALTMTLGVVILAIHVLMIFQARLFGAQFHAF